MLCTTKFELPLKTIEYIDNILFRKTIAPKIMQIILNDAIIYNRWNKVKFSESHFRMGKKVP